MAKRNSTNYLLFLLASDILLTGLSLYLASRARLLLPFGARLTPKFVYIPPSVYIMAAFIWSLAFILLSVYDPKRTLRFIDEIQTLLPAIGAATLMFAGALYLSFRMLPRLQFFYFFLINLLVLVGLRLLLRLAFRFAGGPERSTKILVLGAGKVGCNVVKETKRFQGGELVVVGFLDDDLEKQKERFEEVPVLGTLDEAPRIVQEMGIDEVVFALPLKAHKRLANLVVELQKLPVQVKVVPDFFDLAFFRANIGNVGNIPLISLRESAVEGFPRLVKRVFDLIVATLLLIILAPFTFLVAILIKLDSPGPAIFKQERVGENLKTLQMYKFRTMFEGADELLQQVMVETADGKLIHKSPHDPRVTRIGRWLRRTSLDELPQLINVIKGEMSLVGPRPELPLLVDRYEPWQRKRFAVPPGMTGWWQISGRSDHPMHFHTEDDLYYIQNYSLLLDLEILWKTIGVVLSGRGAY